MAIDWERDGAVLAFLLRLISQGVTEDPDGLHGRRLGRSFTIESQISKPATSLS